MAGIAGDLAFALKDVLIERHHHPDHLPGSLLGFLVVLVEGVLDMAMIAAHAE